MAWYRDVINILGKEPETWLAYLYGQQLGNMPNLLKGKPRYRGMFFALLRFFRHLMKYLRIRETRVATDYYQFFVFYGSDNQRNSLDRTLDELRLKGVKAVAFAPASFIKNTCDKEQTIPFFYSPVDVFRAVCLLFLRGRKLYRTLKGSLPVEADRYFANFCYTYSYLCAFYRILSSTRPAFVITANDHNIPNRCMLAVAHHLGIKSVYLQHASVSRLFPALRVNYAFLDGQFALDTYRKCEENRIPNDRHAPVPLVMLTGQKKKVGRTGKLKCRTIGVALNPMDDVSSAIDLVKYLVISGFKLRIRFHPGQPVSDVKKFETTFSSSSTIAFSNTELESIADFMAQIGWMIAGNSSIHLESALAGIASIYYEFGQPNFPDYYGYVDNGVAKHAKSRRDVLVMLKDEADLLNPKAEAVRYYSATYLTRWDGKEGELVADCLLKASRGEVFPIDVVKLK